MKNINLLLLSLFILSFSLHAQEISFTFTANHTCIYAELDSVVVENLTQGGDTVLYYPDTVLTLFFTGIETAPFAGNAFSVSQNYPNPYSSKTQIDVFAPEEDEFTIKVFDITGRQVNTYKNILGRGMHNFVFNGGNSTNYVLTVNSTKFLQKILMIHTGTGEKQNASLLYKGIIPGEKSIKTSEKSNFVYNIGDNLEFTGYVNDDFETIVDAPTTNNDYVFDINNTNPSVPTAGIHVAGEDQIEWNWNTVEDATGYKYNTVDDYFTAADNGTSISYTQADLNCEIAYTLYVWAYNDCGVSTSVELSEITTDCPTITICGEETKIVDVTNSTTGDTWMDRNLGASQTADSSRDYNAYGALFQWGRLSDGHECINWTSSTSGTPVNGNTNITSSVDNPGHSLFITAGSSSDYDWRSPQNNDLWQEVSGTNNPCPDGYRLPTETELDVERASWSSNDADGAFDSPLKLTLTGNHNYSGLITNVGTNGQCWSSTVDGIYGKRMYYASNYAIINSIYRAFGFSVRCIKD